VLERSKHVDVGRRRLGRQHLLADSIGLYVLIAASVLAIAISLIAPRGAMLAYLLNLADKPLRRLLVRWRGRGETAAFHNRYLA
jgi:hypothetical protein